MVNLIDIRNLTSSSTVAQAFFEQLAGRVKNYRVTTVDHAIRLTGGSSRKQVVDLFKKMEELGLGHFIVGRRNGTSRFEWSVGMVETGQAALGESEDIEAIDESELEIAEMSEEEEEEEEESLFVEHCVLAVWLVVNICGIGISFYSFFCLYFCQVLYKVSSISHLIEIAFIF